MRQIDEQRGGAVPYGRQAVKLMKTSLSTNWCARRVESGEEIADKAIELGFDELELGFHTTVFQAKGFKRRLGEIPVGSVHAFCPVPVSAPQGYPELYSLASSDADARAIARVHVKKNIEFAASMGADTVVLHAGRVPFSSFFSRSLDSQFLSEALREAEGDLENRAYAKVLAKAKKRRDALGTKILDVFMKEIEAIVPVLEKNGITLAFENLPYLEGFPDEAEMAEIEKRFDTPLVASWFDTGHDRVRAVHGWKKEAALLRIPAGMHLNDVEKYNDDHFAPGGGKVDFASLSGMAEKVRHVVFEPGQHVSERELVAGIEFWKKISSQGSKTFDSAR